MVATGVKWQYTWWLYRCRAPRTSFCLFVVGGGGVGVVLVWVFLTSGMFHAVRIGVAASARVSVSVGCTMFSPCVKVGVGMSARLREIV